MPAEGAATLVIERRSHAVRRGAKIYGVLRSSASGFGRPAETHAGSCSAITNVVGAALDRAGIAPEDLAHISPQGYSHSKLDVTEAIAIAKIAPKTLVSAFSSYWGTAGAACGLLDLTASILAARNGVVLPTLGFQSADDACPVNVCRHLERATAEHILKISFTPMGHAAAVVVQCTK